MEWVVLGIQAFINIGLLSMVLANHYGVGGRSVVFTRSNH